MKVDQGFLTTWLVERLVPGRLVVTILSIKSLFETLEITLDSQWIDPYFNERHGHTSTFTLFQTNHVRSLKERETFRVAPLCFMSLRTIWIIQYSGYDYLSNVPVASRDCDSWKTFPDQWGASKESR